MASHKMYSVRTLDGVLRVFTSLELLKQYIDDLMKSHIYDSPDFDSIIIEKVRIIYDD